MNKTLSAVTISLIALFFAHPSLAATTDDVRPPEIGMVQPMVFRVNHLTTFQTTVASAIGLNGCYLYLNGQKAGRMNVHGGIAQLAQVFLTPETRYANVRCEDATGLVGIGATVALLADQGDVPPKGYLPAGFHEEQLLKPTCLPGDWQGDYCHEIYVIRNGERHAFQSSAAFASWYPTTPAVMSVSIDALSSVPLGDMISMQPGLGDVRFLSQRQVYQVVAPGRLRKTIAGASEPVDVLTDAFFSQFSIEPDSNTSNGTQT